MEDQSLKARIKRARSHVTDGAYLLVLLDEAKAQIERLEGWRKDDAFKADAMGERFRAILDADLAYDAANDALLKARAERAARGSSGNPGKEQAALTKAALVRRNAIKAAMSE